MKKEPDAVSKIIDRKTSELIPYARNSRTHSEEQVSQIAASIKEFGFVNPILTDGDSGVIAGHGRLLAAKKLGLENVPTIDLSHFTEAQKRAYVIADNKLALNSGWDLELLASEITGLEVDDFDLDLLGFSASEMDGLFADDEEAEEPDEGLSEDYTQKIESPVYQMKGERPEVSELFDTAKTEQLKKEIEAEKLPEEIRDFLMAAAERHTVFNFRNIAEFYAHADAKTQDLMERSALVIIDFNKAIDNGYVKLSKSMAELVKQEKACA